LKRYNNITFILVLGFSLLLLISCQSDENTLTIYTSVDRNYSEQVFNDFEEKTGIKVLPAYDTEASKTTGMVNKLIEEQNNPVANVFWNGEFAQTILLKEKGILASYTSPEAAVIPKNYKDDEGYWTAFGGRARCILVNTDLLTPNEYPDTFADVLDDQYEASKVGLAYPIFGTTATHAAAIFAEIGESEATSFYERIKKRGVRIVDGNGVVRDLVADGTLLFGLTDTDDALGAVNKGKPVKIIWPDQGPDQQGTLIVPNTVAIIKGSENNENARAFVDYILSEETSDYLFEIGWIQGSTRAPDGEVTILGEEIKTIDVSLEEVYENIEKAKEVLGKVFIR
jgi:iron(III) transport system substrate-binding protein